MPLKSSVRGESRTTSTRAATTPRIGDGRHGRRRVDGARVGVVVVVAEDVTEAEQVAAIPGVRIGRTTTTGLNQAIHDGLSDLAAECPVAVLPGDLRDCSPANPATLAAADRHPFAVVAIGRAPARPC